MPRFDPRLQFFLQERPTATMFEEVSERFGVQPESIGAPDPEIRLLLRFEGELPSEVESGFRATTVAGDVAAGIIRASDAEKLRTYDNLTLVESSRPMHDELNVSIADIRAHMIHAGPPPQRGAGALIGIIDSGIDFTHACFRNPDGSSRVLAIWDQHLTRASGESSPQPYGYGVEYTKAQIDDLLLKSKGTVRHFDQNGHGTHVAGIAAGNGSPATNGLPAGTFLGVAPEADLLVVRNLSGRNLGDSAQTLDAVDYLLRKAKELGGRTIVINQSQGDNLGPHDGTSLLERGIDHLMAGPGHAMVKSAGNAGDSGAHARGTVGLGATVEIAFRVPPGDNTPDTIDIWYPASDAFDFELRTPAGALSARVRPNAPSVTLTLPNGNQAFVESSSADPFNGDNRIYLQLMPGSGGNIEAGTWHLVLTGATVADGRFDAWIERGHRVPSFTGPEATPEGTITVPGTARSVITVGAYITVASAGVGGLASFSSRGPTRDGRDCPVVCAPGQEVTSALSNAGGPMFFHGMSGTSMAAPHVAGTVALMLNKNPALDEARIRGILQSCARRDTHTTPTPAATEWGGGKLDAAACYAAA